MGFTEIVKTEEVQLENAILLEGLPGVGNVGKLAATHLIEELNAKKCIEIYSSYFPPQVLIDDDGIVKLVNNELYYYHLCTKLIELVKQMGVTTIYTLGGYGLGKLVPDPRVLGAATSDEIVKLFKGAGVEFIDGEPGAGIVGASGLLLGLGKLQGIHGGCLMGETSGYMVDPRSASAVLKSLQKLLNIKIDLSELEERAKQVDSITSQLKEMDTAESEDRPDVNYIG